MSIVCCLQGDSLPGPWVGGASPPMEAELEASAELIMESMEETFAAFFAAQEAMMGEESRQASVKGEGSWEVKQEALDGDIRGLVDLKTAERNLSPSASRIGGEYRAGKDEGEGPKCIHMIAAGIGNCSSDVEAATSAGDWKDTTGSCLDRHIKCEGLSSNGQEEGVADMFPLPVFSGDEGYWGDGENEGSHDEMLTEEEAGKSGGKVDRDEGTMEQGGEGNASRGVEMEDDQPASLAHRCVRYGTKKGSLYEINSSGPVMCVCVCVRVCVCACVCVHVCVLFPTADIHACGVCVYSPYSPDNSLRSGGGGTQDSKVVHSTRKYGGQQESADGVRSLICSIKVQYMYSGTSLIRTPLGQ